MIAEASDLQQRLNISSSEPSLKELRNLLVIAKGNYNLGLDVRNATMRVYCGRRLVLTTDNAHEVIGLLKGLSQFPKRDLLREAIVAYDKGNHDDGWADNVVDHLLGRPTMQQIVKGLIS